MKQNIYNCQAPCELCARFLMIFVLSFIISACSSNEELPDSKPDTQEKTPIELKVGIVGDASTRSVVTTDVDNRAQAFEKGTSLYMVLQSDNGAGTGTMYSRTVGYVEGTSSTTANSSDVTFTTSHIRLWQDSYSLNSKLSVYAACVPGYYLLASCGGTSNGTVGSAMTIGGSTEYTTSPWTETAATTTINWPLNGASVDGQTVDFINQQDLCFSNNVSNLIGENRIYFNRENNKFTGNRLVFYHALTRITFKIKRGTGYGSDGFRFTDGDKNIVLNDFNTTGTFDISQGEFTPSNKTQIKKLCDMPKETDYAYVFSGLILPGTDLYGDDKDQINKVSLTIDGQTFHVTKSQLKAALDGKTITANLSALDNNKMRPGVHYIFTMELGKKAVDKLTAAVVPWEEVKASQTTPTNAKLTISLLDRDSHISSDFSLYRSIITGETDDITNYDWATGYVGNSITPTWNSAKSAYSANWYWDTDKTFFHLRAVSPTNATVSNNTNIDNISLTAKGNTEGEMYTDVCWGAPFINTALDANSKLPYSLTTGFDDTTRGGHTIYKAIGPTNDPIKLIMFHMMSEVTIELKTVSGEGAVGLTGATVSLSNIYPTGTVAMGTGLVTPTGTQTSLGGTTVNTGTEDSPDYKWTGGFVPQELDGVELTITAAGNQYKISLKDMLATVGDNAIKNPYTVSETAGKYKIGRWYPNYKYTYSFTLTKTGIEKITATLLDWTNVNADNQEIQIK